MKYSNEEKLSIVARCQQGESVAALSNELAIPRSTLYRWLQRKWQKHQAKSFISLTRQVKR